MIVRTIDLIGKELIAWLWFNADDCSDQGRIIDAILAIIGGKRAKFVIIRRDCSDYFSLYYSQMLLQRTECPHLTHDSALFFQIDY